MSSAFTRGWLMVTMGVVLVGVSFGTSGAATELGEFCFNLAPLIDTLRVSVTETSGSTTMASLVFRWRFGTSAQILGTGALTDSLLSPGSFDFTLVGMHNTTFFGNQKICSLFGVITPPLFTGTWQYTCTGGGGAPFTGSGTLNPVVCTPAM
jgi:hypothetical protein